MDYIWAGCSSRLEDKKRAESREKGCSFRICSRVSASRHFYHVGGDELSYNYNDLSNKTRKYQGNKA